MVFMPVHKRMHNPIGGKERNSSAVGPLTAVLIGISVVIGIWSKLGERDDVVRRLLLTEYLGEGDGFPFQEIARGEVWRVISPMFLHFGIVHLLFNMMWLKDLGTAIEKRTGTKTLLVLALLSEVLGNFGQYFITGPYFGGMSGVVYCLFGYVWMKAKFEPMSGFRLDKQTVILMIGWFFLCMTGAIGPVANVGHGVGLVVGVVWGFLAAKRASRLFR